MIIEQRHRSWSLIRVKTLVKQSKLVGAAEAKSVQLRYASNDKQWDTTGNQTAINMGNSHINQLRGQRGAKDGGQVANKARQGAAPGKISLARTLLIIHCLFIR